MFKVIYEKKGVRFNFHQSNKNSNMSDIPKIVQSSRQSTYFFLKKIKKQKLVKFAGNLD